MSSQSLLAGALICFPSRIKFYNGKKVNGRKCYLKIFTAHRINSTFNTKVVPKGITEITFWTDIVLLRPQGETGVTLWTWVISQGQTYWKYGCRSDLQLNSLYQYSVRQIIAYKATVIISPHMNSGSECRCFPNRKINKGTVGSNIT